MTDRVQIDPQQIADELKSFRETAACLSSNEPSLIDQYPKQWIALCMGKVRVHGETFQDVLKKLDAGGFPRDQSILRYIDPEPKTMIL